MFTLNPKRKRNIPAFLFCFGGLVLGPMTTPVSGMPYIVFSAIVAYITLSIISNLIAIPLEKMFGGDNKRAQDTQA